MIVAVYESTLYVKTWVIFSLNDVAKKADASLDPEGSVIELTRYRHVANKLSFVHNFTF